MSALYLGKLALGVMWTSVVLFWISGGAYCFLEKGHAAKAARAVAGVCLFVWVLSALVAIWMAVLL
jgi:hypothetical protein